MERGFVVANLGYPEGFAKGFDVGSFADLLVASAAECIHELLVLILAKWELSDDVQHLLRSISQKIKPL